MIRSIRRALGVMLAVLVAAGGLNADAKSYSSGGGHSYSSHSSSGSSHSSSSGSHSSSSRSSSGSSHGSSSGSSHRGSSGSSSRSSGGTSTRSSGGGSTYSSSGGSSHTATGNSGSQRSSGGSASSNKSYKSSSGSSYSSGSSSGSASSDRHSYTSGKSYSAGSGWSFSSGSGSDNSGSSSQTYRRSQPAPDNSPSSSFSYDAAAAHARQEEVSKANYSEYKRSKAPPVIADNSTPSTAPAGGTPSYQAKPPPILPPSRSSYRRTVYVPDNVTISTRPVRIYNYYSPYYSRPWVTYNDPYGSLFWWWLLDRSLDDRAYWAYHHRYDMDPARYDALLANDRQLESRVEQLETQQAPRDASYVPPGIDQDLMYSDQYVNRSYHNRPTPAGVVFFWVLAVPTALAVTAFFIWLIWFKRWQTAA